jgi:hypothetical protein
MVRVIKRTEVDLTATFSQMVEGDTVEIATTDVREGQVRMAAGRFSKANNMKLRVSATAAAVGHVIVTRTA